MLGALWGSAALLDPDNLIESHVTPRSRRARKEAALLDGGRFLN